MKFNEYLKKVRLRSKLTLAEAAQKISVLPGTYRSWEKGICCPLARNFCALEEVFALPPGTLSKRLYSQHENTVQTKVYLIHPLRANAGESNLDHVVAENRNKASQICRLIAAKNPHIHILSPIHAFAFCDHHGDQSQVFGYCEALLELADEAWVYGDYQKSEGCKREIQLAQELKIPVKRMNVDELL